MFSNIKVHELYNIISAYTGLSLRFEVAGTGRPNYKGVRENLRNKEAKSLHLSNSNPNFFSCLCVHIPKSFVNKLKTLAQDFFYLL